MSNEALNRRIAEEFMGWELSLDKSTWCEEGECLRGIEDFYPTTDMRAAYLVLEKINTPLGEIEISFINYIAEIGEYSVRIVCNAGDIEINNQSLPLAISRLAEAIMDSPEHMGLFK